MTPTLHDCIVEWLKNQLPKARYEEIKGGFEIHLDKMVCGIRTKCFSLQIKPNEITVVGVGCLTDTFTVEDDAVVAGKWGAHKRIQAATPYFFGELSYYLAWTAQVVTMGGYSPNWPKDTELDQPKGEATNGS